MEASVAKSNYAELMKMTSPCEKVIRRDITRTYPEHEFFKEEHGLGQESLFNVIKVRTRDGGDEEEEREKRIQSVKANVSDCLLYPRLIRYTIGK